MRCDEIILAAASHICVIQIVWNFRQRPEKKTKTMIDHRLRFVLTIKLMSAKHTHHTHGAKMVMEACRSRTALAEGRRKIKTTHNMNIILLCRCRQADLRLDLTSAKGAHLPHACYAIDRNWCDIENEKYVVLHNPHKYKVVEIVEY